MSNSLDSAIESIRGLVSSKVTRWLICAGVAFGSGTAYGYRNADISQANPVNQSGVTTVQYTASQYEKLKLQDTLTDVKAILGDGIEVSHAQHRCSTSIGVVIAEYRWVNSSDGSMIEAVFHDGRLVEKTQAGLQ